MILRKGFVPLAGLLCGSALWAGAVQAGLGDNRQAELRHMLLHDCGSCHGMTLQGGLGLPLTTEALRGKSEEFLFLTIRDGHPGTPMPPWKGVLSEEEIRYLVQVLTQGITQ